MQYYARQLKLYESYINLAFIRRMTTVTFEWQNWCSRSALTSSSNRKNFDLGSSTKLMHLRWKSKRLERTITQTNVHHRLRAETWDSSFWPVGLIPTRFYWGFFMSGNQVQVGRPSSSSSSSFFFQSECWSLIHPKGCWRAVVQSWVPEAEHSLSKLCRKYSL